LIPCPATKIRIASKIPKPGTSEEAIGAAAGPLRLFLDSDSTLLKDLLASPQENATKDPAFLLVGPEGGWTDVERQQAQAAGYRSASLGTGILRAETAALTAVAITTHILAQQPSRVDG
jgi:16S rRNA U1498 N3-methylase RsmE